MGWWAKKIKKFMMTPLSSWSDGSVDEQRSRQEKLAGFMKLPANVRCQPVDANGVPAEWIEAPGVDRGVILYLHGGAYSLGSIHTHREFTSRLSRSTGTRVLVINYRLAPEHSYPAALEDAITAYRWLLTQGINPSRVIVAGDSAGGGLTLATLLSLRDAGDSLPAGAVCISPWTDLTCSGDSIQTRTQEDLILTLESLSEKAKYYAVEHDLRSPLISPLFAELSGLPPLLIQVGTDEILLDDSRRFAEKAQKAGVDVTLEIWDDMFHVFQMIPFMPTTKKALGQIGGFVTRILSSRL